MSHRNPEHAVGADPDMIPSHVKSNYVDCVTVPTRRPRNVTPLPPLAGRPAGGDR